MKILIAGASGAIGSQLVPQLVARGHEVVGTTRSAAKIGALRALGAEPVILDALDPDSAADVVAKAEPEVIVHQLTALSGRPSFLRAKRMAAATNRLRSVPDRRRRRWGVVAGAYHRCRVGHGCGH